MVAIAGYIVLGLSFLFAVLALSYGRDRLVAHVFSYLVAYEALRWGLIFLDKYQDTPYMSLAIVIDCFWFYLFISRSSLICGLCAAFSALYGGATLSLLILGYSNSDAAYGPVGLAVSIIMLMTGAYRGLMGRHYADSGGGDLPWLSNKRFGQIAKRAKG